MKFAVIKNGSNPERDGIASAIERACLAHGHELCAPENGARFVLNLTDADAPRSFRRRARSVFVFSLLTLRRPPDTAQGLRSLCYATLVRTLSNVLLCAVPKDAGAADGTGPAYEMYFTTPEAGFYHLEFDAERVYERIIPIAGARFAIANRFSEDLPERLWRTSPVVERIKRGGNELDELGVLPSPFRLQDVLSDDSIRHIYKLFEMRSLSYGNLSARERVPELGDTTFWMTARGVDKARLSKVGWDILLVKGFDYEAVQALISVPPDHDPRARVSVDAVEHELIYRTFPAVGAVVHVHAWMDGVLCTGQNYPCGTIELAEDVVGLLARTGRPERAAVGLRNHGLTITGPDLDEIFGRIRGRLRTEVPMMA
ncbi:MAG TPA: class II aldolase/adducin family protein [Candidatus Aminicenantes bacterium]|nr:class II aldolase/adducin family protein [Candidatus Aminicenantes bacterium]